MKIKSSYKLILVLTFALLACSKWGGNNPVGVTGGVTAWQNLSSGNDGSSTSSLIGSWRYDSDNYYEILTFILTVIFQYILMIMVMRKL